MGPGPSREQVEQDIADTDARRKREFEQEKIALAELDAHTRVGHLMIELRNLGFVELQGKDIGGIYDRIDHWLKKHWGARRTTKDIVPVAEEVCCDDSCQCGGFKEVQGIGDVKDHDRLCDASWTLGEIGEDGMPRGSSVFKARGSQGENNMGKLSMQLVNFMTNECGWTLQVLDAGNLGWKGDIREQQMKFRAPHPLNLIAPHIMIELRAAGYIEVNGPDSGGVYLQLATFFASRWGASRVQADPDYCDLKFSCSRFAKRGSEGENNMGQMTMELVDFMVKKCVWTCITCNGGNYGRKGDQREQQLVFRNDEFVQHGENHVMAELRTSGYIELNSLHDAADFGQALESFCKNTWGCKDYTPYFWEGSEKYCDKKLTCPDGFYYKERLTNNLGKRTLEMAEFAGRHGWSLLLANGGSISPQPKDRPNFIIREQQLKFTKMKNKVEAARPLLMIEIRTQPTDYSPATYDSFVEINGPNTAGIYEKLDRFITAHMKGRFQGRTQYCDALYRIYALRLKDHKLGWDIWDGRLNGESNIGKWTMRLCDFMVDHIGEWDLITCNSDNVDWNFRIDKDRTTSVTGREMQMVFRHRPGGKDVFMSVAKVEALGRPPMQPPPHWSDKAKQGQVGHSVVPGTPEELKWMQQLLDGTYKAKATRDRKEALAERFVAVSCLRSEHPALWDKFARRRKDVLEACRNRGAGVEAEFVVPKTMAASPELAERCAYQGKNPTAQAFLLHGTSPTSAVAILATSFKVDLAGKSAGTMFGPGIYLAEASTKADEYARDDQSGDFAGLYAVLVCRAVLGRPFTTLNPGDYREQCTSGEYDVVIGDREKAVGTYREFIFFHEGSVYPEYAVFYRREGGAKSKTPPAAAPAMHTMVAPTPAVIGAPTGNHWQYQGGGPDSWHDFAPEVQAALVQARDARATAPVRFKIGEREYSVDISTMVQTALDTGKQRPVRCIVLA